MNNNTALLIFARTADHEAQCKAILSGERNQRLFDHLNQRTLVNLRKSKLDTFCFTQKQQQGRSFGERITHAISHVFDRGYQNVIVVGNDCPDLSLADVQKAKTKLRNNQLVLGPDHRGGAYLIGISRDLFNPNIFEELPWQTTETLQALLGLVGKGESIVLSQKQDLNHAKDAEVLAEISTDFRFILSLLISIKKNFIVHPELDFTSVSTICLPLRAPPQAA